MNDQPQPPIFPKPPSGQITPPAELEPEEKPEERPVQSDGFGVQTTITVSTPAAGGVAAAPGASADPSAPLLELPAATGILPLPIVGSRTIPSAAGIVNDTIFAMRSRVGAGSYKGMQIPIINGGTNNTNVLQSMGGTIECAIFSNDGVTELVTSGALGWPANIFLPALIQVNFTTPLVWPGGTMILCCMGRGNADALKPIPITWINDAEQGWNDILGDFLDPTRVHGRAGRLQRGGALIGSAGTPAFTGIPGNWQALVDAGAPPDATCTDQDCPVFLLVPK